MNVALGGLIGGSVLDVSASAGPVAVAMGVLAVAVLLTSATVLLVAAWRRRGG
jgi:hypothetical protein